MSIKQEDLAPTGQPRQTLHLRPGSVFPTLGRLAYRLCPLFLLLVLLSVGLTPVSGQDDPSLESRVAELERRLDQLTRSGRESNTEILAHLDANRLLAHAENHDINLRICKTFASQGNVTDATTGEPLECTDVAIEMADAKHAYERAADRLKLLIEIHGEP